MTTEVTAHNYVRAESDLQMKLWIKNMDCFGKFNHNRKPYEEGYMTDNEYNAHSFNNVTAKKAKDGSIIIHFGGDPKADNFLPIVPGWNYLVRMYKPGPEILDGSWKFPYPEPVE